ncbi:3-hydroxyisobutyrate dehydrogenase [Streptomyces rubellomurinus]|uniref:3-hydroxyisobutyrate dehydrogenase n=1 Tax=Streptomyces rubellomurinus (strain ATCC 31215) TaxID=359131 RepID=A0A0F2TAM0_STRR3|nr:3-hydroxyisobutyrate dehydrogenase [Streptomyces rubellomurinus]KJS59476.1 3-hydroxyisobutyrate dehydrogenase [Streptomyces rubellomurinus]
MTHRIGFVGLGNMGGPMAANLVKAGHRVTGYDLAEAARTRAADHGVAVAASAAEAVTGADLVITMLPTGRHVLDAYQELTVAARGALFVDCSTIAVGDARVAADLARVAGHRAVDAPVSGGVAGAEAASLTFMVGADDPDFAEAEPVLAAMGRRVVHCGASGAGQAAKVCNNMILGISMIAVSEAFVLGESLGLSHQALFDVASTASGQCWALTSNCPVPGPVPGSPANRDYAAGFAAALMAKDLGLAADAATALAVPAELGRQAAELYAAFAAGEGGALDFSAIITTLREDAA